MTYRLRFAFFMNASPAPPARERFSAPTPQPRARAIISRMKSRCLAVLLGAALAAAAHAQPKFDDILKNLHFRDIGPATMGGRIGDFAVVESNPQIIFVGAASGGVWKSINGGTTWTPIFDGQGSPSIGDVTIAPSDPSIVWVGAGEP